MHIRSRILLTIVASLLGGCDAARYAANLMGAGGKIDAVYELADRPTVVFVDDPQNLLPTTDLADYLAGRVGDQLSSNEVVGQVIPTSMLTRLRAETPEFGQWAIDKIGQHVGAQQVIYVVVQNYQLVEDSAIVRPTATLNVKVVEVDSGNRLFPTNVDRGHPVYVQRDYGNFRQDTATRTVIARELADDLAVEVANLFYKHAPPQPGERLPG